MKIRMQLIISMIFFSIALLIISASIISTNQKVERLNAQEELVKNTELKANELSYLSNNFLLYRESQHIDRWESQYSSITDDISNLAVDNPDQQALVNNLKADMQRLKAVFDDVVSKIKSSSQTQSSALDPAFIQVSSSRIGVQTQGIISDASRLSQKIRDEGDQLELINYLLSIALLGIFGVFLLSNYFLIYRRTLKSISNLQAGASIVGSGNLDFSIEEKQGDEFGELSHAFNRMTTQLKTVTASKTDLEREITERRRAEAALREATRRFQAIVDHAPIAIYVKNRDGRFVFGNRKLEQYTGQPLERLLGMTDYDFAPKEDADRWRENDLKVLEGQRAEFEETGTDRDGRPYVNISMKFPLSDESGTPVEVCGISADITERKRAEEALRKAHDELELRVQERTVKLQEANKQIEEWALRLEETNMELEAEIDERKQAEEKTREQAELLDKAQDAIGLRDLEHRIIYWNKGAQRLYGWTAEEITGKNADEILYIGESSSLIEAKKSVIKTGEWMGELVQITKEEKKIIVESRWTLVRNSTGKPESILIINTDITERKKLESQLLQAQRMESIGMFAGGIAHDLNNVLTPIMLSLRMLRKKFTDEQSQKLLAALDQSSQRGANMIKQVLTFARGIEGERSAVQVSHIISDIEKMAKETFPGNIEIQINIPEDLWTVSGDATQLHQVIMNLCINARDAMPGGGTLCISAENLLIDETLSRMNTEAKTGPHITISVSDTGTGIPPEIIDRIYEPFFTTKKYGKGTGLGLSISMAIVKSHHGFINVYSELGKGTVFKIYLPAIKKEILEAEAQQLELPSGKGEYILIAEDEDAIREITAMTLEASGYKVLSAADGREAVELYDKNKDRIKIVLMDMMMPVMDGHASILAICGVNPDVKIIAVSGLAEYGKSEKIANIQAFLPKPYSTERLLKTIDEVINFEQNNIQGRKYHKAAG